MIERDLTLADGRTLHVYDTGEPGDGRTAVVWHHGSPNIGAPPRPLFAAADRLGLRWLSYDRPSYGGSTPRPGRDIAAAAADVEALVDAADVGSFALVGHSGGASHALASAALLPDRALGVLSIAPMAPLQQWQADGLDYWAGMIPSGVDSLQAAAQGAAAKEAYEASGADYDPGFTAADMDTFRSDWAWLDEVVGPGTANGPGGLIADDLAYVGDWGFDVADIRCPVLVLTGGQDRIAPAAHGGWIADRAPQGEQQHHPEDGHLSVLRHAEAALELLAGRIR
ncbi:alpha/beta fold hydrolase [Nakamurella sp. YIM 132087]|uniref:Alpha/beta fold hydrolase n=1 Tax=Nakamurella alba TaxID=2665158 RepID=A0A7K1FFL6_9ACTN|nr:alpha/beta fold hydrolase [Nakamurella alba]